MNLEAIETAPSPFPSPPQRGRGCRRPERGRFRGAKRKFVQRILSLRERVRVRGNSAPDRIAAAKVCPENQIHGW
jgi:hypothetical protein